MNWGNEELQAALLGASGVTSLLSTFTDDTPTSHPCIFYEKVLPEWLDQVTYPKTINYYRTSTINGGINYGNFFYSIACRADSSGEAEAIQKAVDIALNRNSENSVFFICTVLEVIEPKDDTDNYNAPIEVQIKTRGL